MPDGSALAASLQATTPEALRAAAPDAIVIGAGAVSYTHLTLPTIYSV